MSIRADGGAPRPRDEAALAGVRVDGKFFADAVGRLHLRGVAYGPFQPRAGAGGEPFPGDDVVRADFARMRELGANTVRTYTPPPLRVLDAAAEAGLRLLVGIPWTQHVCFLEERLAARDARRRVARVAGELGGHPAVLALLLGNEIPPDVVRWEGPARVERFLRELADVARQRAPEALLSYASFPPTEYLDLGFLDFHAVNLFLEHRADFRRYLGRLQNLAEGRPLVLTEVGLDSSRNGEAAQAAALGWQVRDAFDGGAAGVVVFAFTDEWFSLDPTLEGGGFAVDDWAFGVVGVDRTAKPAFAAVREAFALEVPDRPDDLPLVSVIVCAFDAERTLGACLRSLRDLRYPRLEVIVVDDGSTDRTGEIAAEFASAHVRIVRQENRGLSAARNRGVAEARGSVVAFTDADCMVDPDWLEHLVAPLRRGFAGVGGPNLTPPEPRRIPNVVAAAPGRPTHVLMHDEVAEHVPGCNMAFDRRSLLAVGGFSERYRVAGDDVDVCWRLQDAGHRIGFSAAAVVWHFRRHTITGYLRQQCGYGRAEALLWEDHPRRFDSFGRFRWRGRIYGADAPGPFPGSPRIYHGPLGQAAFQSIYERRGASFGSLPLTFEWTAVAVLLLACALAFGDGAAPYALPLVASVLAAVWTAGRARLAEPWSDLRSRAVLALLAYAGPVARGFERWRGALRAGGATRPTARADRGDRASAIRLHRGEVRAAYWSEAGATKADVVGALQSHFARHRLRARLASGWTSWDLEVEPSWWACARIEAAVESHGGPRRLVRLRTTVRPTPASARLVMGALAGVAVGAALDAAPLVGASALLAAALGACTAVHGVWLGRGVERGIEEVARESGLVAVEPRGRQM